jgi:hypothetical protein
VKRYLRTGVATSDNSSTLATPYARRGMLNEPPPQCRSIFPRGFYLGIALVAPPISEFL